MITATEIPDESKLGSPWRGKNVYLVLGLKDDQLPQTWQEYKQWRDDTQHRLGLALGQYGLAIGNIINPGDGNKEDWEREDEERRLHPGSISDPFSAEKNAQRGFDEKLRSSKKVLVHIVTQDRHDHRDGENHFDRGPATARERLETFVSELERQRQAPDSPPLLRGMKKIAEERRLGFRLNQSLKLFDDVRLAEAEDHELRPVNGALTLRMKLSEDGPHFGWKAMLKRFDEYPNALQEETALNFLGACTDREIKHCLGQDLGKYGLVPVTGRLDRGNREFVFTVVERNRYNEFTEEGTYRELGDEGRKLIPDKAFGGEPPSQKTIDWVNHYIADFARARELGLEKSQGRQM